MNVGTLKKILSVIDDNADINIDIYRSGKIDSKCTLSAIVIDAEYDEISDVFLVGHFDKPKE